MHTHCGPLLASFILPFMLHFPSLLAIFVQLRLGHHPRVAAPCIASSAWIATVRFASGSLQADRCLRRLGIPLTAVSARAHTGPEEVQEDDGGAQEAWRGRERLGRGRLGRAAATTAAAWPGVVDGLVGEGRTGRPPPKGTTGLPLDFPGYF